MPKRARPASETASEAPRWYEALYSGAMSDEYKRYMADEWAHEKRGDRPLFEKLSLEGAQAGLSWATILAKREGYRAAFHGFDIAKCASMTSKDVDALLSSSEATIVRHRGKIESVIENAKCVQALVAEAEASKAKAEHGHFDAFLWSHVDGTPRLNEWADAKAIPSESEAANELSKALKARGFKFVGPKICYSLMQSCGLVVDHPKGTPEWEAARARLEGRSTSGGGAKRGRKAEAAPPKQAQAPPKAKPAKPKGKGKSPRPRMSKKEKIRAGLMRCPSRSCGRASRCQICGRRRVTKPGR